MTATMRQVREQKIAEIEQAIGRARFLHLVPRILIHGSAPNGSRACPCCGSRSAAIVETRPLPEVVIDCVTGRRVYVADVSERTWSKVTAAAERHDVPLRMSSTQADLILPERAAPFRIASGGNRAAKTTAGLIFLAMEWLSRGGCQRRFWLIASTIPKAYRLLEKLFLGTGESPPILPRALVRSMPATHRASDLRTFLADGSVFDLKPFAGDPGAERAKSDAIVAALVDEAAHLPTVDWVTALRGRCLDAGGRLWFASTPRPGHFLRAFVDNALAFERLPADDERRTSGAHEGARWLARAFPIPSNPWLDPDEIAAELASLNKDSPSVRRDVFGEWNTAGGVLWRDFSHERHVFVHEARTISAMLPMLRQRTGVSLVDVTERVVGRLTVQANPHARHIRANNRRFIVGSDFNCHPMSSVIVQIAGDPTAPDDRDRYHVVVHDSPQSAHSNALHHAERLVDPVWVRTWDPTARASPFLNALMICDPQAIGRDPTAHKHGRDPSGLASTLACAGFDGRAPSYWFKDGGWKPVRLTRYNTHFLIHRLIKEGRLHISARALALIESLLNQEDGGDGVSPYVESHTKSDKLAGPVDALRYAVWAVYHGGHTTGGPPAAGSLPGPGSLPSGPPRA